MNLDLRTSAIERAAQAWADFYLWAQEQPNVAGTQNRTFTGPVADDILRAAGITFDADPLGYREAADEVVRQGYALAGGKHDLRGLTLSGNMAKLAKRARTMRREGLTRRAIAAVLGISATTVYKMTRHAA